MEFLNYGGARLVFKDGDKVIKYPLSPSGIIENQTEAQKYNETQSEFLAPCELKDNKIIIMDYLDDQTFEYFCWKNNCVYCKKYDCADTRITEAEITCEHKCTYCKDRAEIDFSGYENLADLIAPESRVQCGFDKDNKLKIYDYGSENIDELRGRECLRFNSALVEDFLQWIEDGNEPEDFLIWAKENLPEKFQHKDIPDYRWFNKRIRERRAQRFIIRDLEE